VFAVRQVQQEEQEVDLIAEALRRAFRVQSHMPDPFEELLRRLAEKDERAPRERDPSMA
jgi:hypothetical protein